MMMNAAEQAEEFAIAIWHTRVDIVKLQAVDGSTIQL
jgi:hypothetical protein